MLLTVVQTLLFNFLDGKNFPVSKQTKQKTTIKTANQKKKKNQRRLLFFPYTLTVYRDF